ncbi:class I SAM-dependent methyltransferase [Actibacterium sp. 188UL27-1]|uniref:class I SAM-dependent methyltransferase n=1 Tax=Actibacterium sp. 188UL27-1 TaxID=2786961 RepID=UPI0019564643|nr:class I SAM-dependent methyltransferase [Actibacterium sp. 188UL27-1]MBM7066174.1 class I SAM-dependent methyltransferase [Actibacterium sp. 188UL27-1]
MSPPRSSRFWDRMAPRYSRLPIADEAAYRRKLDITQSYLRPDMDVFEFGCGTGSTALVHAPFVRHIQATDLSQAMLKIAQDKAAAAGVTNVSFSHAAIEDWIPGDTGYDMVLGLSILHLLEDKEAALAKCHRMLKPGGLLVSSTVCLKETMPYFKLIAPLGKALGLMPTLRVFTCDELARNIMAAGFGIEHRWQPTRSKAVFIVARKI